MLVDSFVRIYFACSSVSIVNFEHAIAGWDMSLLVAQYYNVQHVMRSLHLIVLTITMAVLVCHKKISFLKKRLICFYFLLFLIFFLILVFVFNCF